MVSGEKLKPVGPTISPVFVGPTFPPKLSGLNGANQSHRSGQLICPNPKNPFVCPPERDWLNRRRFESYDLFRWDWFTQQNPIIRSGTKWWFETFFIFTPIIGKISNLTHNFSDGLKPPTSKPLMEEILHQLIVNRYFIPLFTGFSTSQVVQDFCHQQ